ncbi:ectonucleotide pyrophosphatase/phosphodiesterase [Oxalobacteraceae bacterium A2-2]
MAAADDHPVVLISLDGFRADYLGRGASPHLERLAARGVRAQAMRPSYPSLTFPNHYTLVTGLRPDHSGMVDNTMEDAARPGQKFDMHQREQVLDPFWWDQAEPAWVTAEKQGMRTAILFWPGAETPIHGVLPTYRMRFDDDIPADRRADILLGWLDLAGEQRPGMLALYLSDVDHAGHDHGPDSREVLAAVARVDAAVGRLQDGLRARGIDANLVIVSDHGMSANDPARTIDLNRVAPAGGYRLLTRGPSAGIIPQPGREVAVAAALLRPHPHMQCWRKQDIPARLHYGSHARVPSLYCLAEPGWNIRAGDQSDKRLKAGSHGYDNGAPAMQALFVAAGPAFRQGVLLPAFDNVDVYPLLMRLAGLPARPSDGSPDTLQQALAR